MEKQIFTLSFGFLVLILLVQHAFADPTDTLWVKHLLAPKTPPISKAELFPKWKLIVFENKVT